MKKYLIASTISLISIVFLSLALPAIFLITTKPGGINYTVFWVYAIILTVSITIVLTTTLLMSRYTSKIDNLDKLETETQNKINKLDYLIDKYNKLLLKDNLKN